MTRPHASLSIGWIDDVPRTARENVGSSTAKVTAGIASGSWRPG